MGHEGLEKQLACQVVGTTNRQARSEFLPGETKVEGGMIWDLYSGKA